MYDVARWESSEPWGLEQEGTDMFPELSLKDTVPMQDSNPDHP